MIPEHLQGPPCDEVDIKQAMGKTRDEVIELLGEPYTKSMGTRKRPTPSIFVYGKYELCFGPKRHDMCHFIMDGLTHETIARYTQW